MYACERLCVCVCFANLAATSFHFSFNFDTSSIHTTEWAKINANLWSPFCCSCCCCCFYFENWILKLLNELIFDINTSQESSYSFFIFQKMAILLNKLIELSWVELNLAPYRNMYGSIIFAFLLLFYFIWLCARLDLLKMWTKSKYFIRHLSE